MNNKSILPETNSSMSVDNNHKQFQLEIVNVNMSDVDMNNGPVAVVKKERLSEEMLTIELEPLNVDQRVKVEIEVPEVSVKIENTTSECSVCFAQLPDEDAYNEHMKIHWMQGGEDDPIKTDSDDPLAPHALSAGWASSLVAGHRNPPVFQNASYNQYLGTYDWRKTFASEEAYSINNPLHKHIVKAKPRTLNTAKRAAPKNNKSLKIARETTSSGNWNSQNKDTDSKHLNDPTTSHSVVIKTETVELVTEPVTELYASKPVQSETECANNNIQCEDPAVNSLNTHLGKSSSHKCFTCYICQKTFEQKYLLVEHIRAHTEVDTFVCKICQYKCKYKSKLVLHMRVHTGEKPFACYICDYRGSKMGNLTKHMKTHTGDKPFTCSLCDYKCGESNRLEKHMKTHTGERPFTCSLCDYKCSEIYRLNKHMRTHTGEKPFNCSECDYKCSRSDHLKNHMRTHTGEKPFACSLCDYKCCRSSKLTNHMRIHTGEKPYTCDLCDYRCSENGKLTRHMRTHTGEKPFTCSICDYRFTQNSSLTNHMRIHTGEKPYACNLCDYKSSQSSSLSNHMRTHTGEKPYICTLCDYKCSDSRYLFNHMRTHTTW